MNCKKISIVVVLVIGLVLVAFTACTDKRDSNGKGITDERGEDKKIKIVATIFPAYDWVREVLGKNADKADLTMLMDNGSDLHSYEPTADDIVRISSADLFIYVGGESDNWVKDALKEADNKDMTVINLMEVLGDEAKEEEIKEGMEEAACDEKEDDHDRDDRNKGVDLDEHVWLSLDNAETFVDAIEDALTNIDPANKKLYEENADIYEDKLEKLDDKFKEIVKKAPKRTVLFGDRFPFLYLTDDYDLDYYAAFVGCSAESEASFETIIFLAEKVDKLGLKYIITLEKSDGKIGDAIIKNTKDKDQKLLVMDSMQSVGKEDVSRGAKYLSIMEANCKVLEKALS